MRRLYARLKLRINASTKPRVICRNRQSSSTGARSQERGCACHATKVPRLFVLGRSRTESHAARRIRNLEAREGARPYANPTRGRAKHGGRVQRNGRILGGMEGLLSDRRDTTNLCGCCLDTQKRDPDPSRARTRKGRRPPARIRQCKRRGKMMSERPLSSPRLILRAAFSADIIDGSDPT